MKIGEKLYKFKGKLLFLSSIYQWAFCQSDDRSIQIWNWETGKSIFILYGHKKEISDLIMSPDGTKMFSASRDRIIKVWDSKTGREIWTLSNHKGVVSGLAVTSDSKKLVSASEDKSIKIWCLKTGTELLTLSGHKQAIIAVAINTLSKEIISFSTDDNLKIWDLTRGLELMSYHGFLKSSNMQQISGQKILDECRKNKYIILNKTRKDKDTIQIIDLLSRKVIGDFTADSSIFCSTVGFKEEIIVAGDEKGKLHFLKIKNN
ncbi:MAG: hypothetical protein F6K16_35275 [Symploca sp. SIO2B6]|nr:hypothetical protein [Symploca sp. SIO2B6]